MNGYVTASHSSSDPHQPMLLQRLSHQRQRRFPLQWHLVYPSPQCPICHHAQCFGPNVAAPDGNDAAGRVVPPAQPLPEDVQQQQQHAPSVASEPQEDGFAAADDDAHDAEEVPSVKLRQVT